MCDCDKHKGQKSPKGVKRPPVLTVQQITPPPPKVVPKGK